MTTWVSRQAFVDLVKITIEKSAKRNEQCNIIKRVNKCIFFIWI